MDKEQLQEIYLKEEYYWGTEPNDLAKKVLYYIAEPLRKDLLLVDLGAGEGRDSVFLLRKVFKCWR
ncbi:hypothetical protein ciss_13290 [Carboxydothermus islandicus]|uniref:SAM-dependent methyltransferase n=1 Tax=Carboxydothermus islandicus TaxID=661089 RepID=A0A1L8D2I1_9THEO|nr:hypothetical protein [Carboxydothermus islandicus]GAV25396.1 hypothetical protein ciss_13290 [Carboxydothermus islandicus]